MIYFALDCDRNQMLEEARQREREVSTKKRFVQNVGIAQIALPTKLSSIKYRHGPM